MNILITGATGFVGQELIRSLTNDGYEVTALVRDIPRAQSKFDHKNIQYVHWPTIHSEFTLPKKEYAALINLMGENIAGKRWSAQRKVQLYNSRVNGTESLLNQISKNNIEVGTLIQGSATGYYGGDLFKEFTEESPAGNDFLAKLCVDWEKIATESRVQFTRVCIIRTSMVIGKNGGACEKLLPVFKMGLGGRLGHGNQYMPWIHLSDLVRIIGLAISDDSMKGPINAVSPDLVDNKDFTKTLGKVLGRPVLFPVPSFALKLALGELSSMLLLSARVMPEALRGLDFKYEYPSLDSALKQVVGQ
jgi:uncharacterized protein (TIGR01777 family)